jgi:hypothetical protein
MPVFFDCDEVLDLPQGLFTQPVRFLLDDIIVTKASKRYQNATEIVVRNYAGGGFVVIAGDFASTRQRQDSLAGQASLSDDLKPFPLTASRSESASRSLEMGEKTKIPNEVPPGAVPFDSIPY